MKFLSIYKARETGVPPTPQEMGKMERLIEERLLAWCRGLPTERHGARVRLSSGKLTVTDGPFGESKEVIGGFALLQANSKQEAIELVKQFLQVAGDGECELRQLFEVDHASTQKAGAS